VHDSTLPSIPRDYVPMLLVPALMLAMLPLVGSMPTWVTLTVAGLAMGMMIFIMSSGLTLVFGLMDVLNFGHGALFQSAPSPPPWCLCRCRAGWKPIRSA